ncbi:MAG TPA: helicase-related protein, partial [Sphingomicrobium sp.]|nr:helicase-related protein [Sphingomicrobium sp.]
SGFAAGQIQGDMDQSDRIAEFDRFKKDEITVLVASDVAARGLDVKGVSHVINFDVPWQPDDYVHRIGRTGRAGMKGIAITLATRADSEAIERIEKLIGHKIPRTGEPPNEQATDVATKERTPKAKAEKARAPAEAKQERQQPTRKSKPHGKTESAPEDRSPVVEDISSDWNGPLPSFLSVSAG